MTRGIRAEFGESYGVDDCNGVQHCHQHQAEWSKHDTLSEIVFRLGLLECVGLTEVDVKGMMTYVQVLWSWRSLRGHT